MSGTLSTRQHSNESNSLLKAEQELAIFSKNVDSILRRHFANRVMRKMLITPTTDKNGKTHNDIIPWFPSRLSILAGVILYFISASMFGFLKIQLLIAVISLAIAVYVSRLIECKVLPRFFFSTLTFHLMRFEERVEDDEYPDKYIYAPAKKSSSGFGYTEWKIARGVDKGHLLACVHDIKGNGIAIIHLRTDGRLAVTSWRRDLYKEDVLPPLPEEVKTLAFDFDKACDKYNQIAKKLENVRALKSNKNIPEQRVLEEIWHKIAIDQGIKDKLISLAMHFAEGSSAASRGLLLYGPPGTGKTLIAKNLAESMGCAFFPLSLPDLKAGFIGQSGEKVKELWQKALAQPRAVIFVDECEGVFCRRGSVSTDSFSEEIVQAFLAQWDGFSKQTTVWVVGATNRRDLIDPAIISRFGEEVEIGLPGDKQRLEILGSELKNKGMDGELPAETAELTQGLSGRDIEALAGRLAREQAGNKITGEVLSKYTEAFRKQGSTNTDSGATWDTLILADSVLKDLKTTAGLLSHAEAFIKKGINVPKGLLLYGPPGTGKTQIARTLANETGLRFIAASTADMKAGFIGQSGQKVRELFERAREAAPCLLFLDELDIVAPIRGAGGDTFTQEIVGQLLQEMDGVKSQSQHVFVLAASNRLDQIDSAVLSRFTKRIEIPNPDGSSRQQLLQVMLKSKPISFVLEHGAQYLAEHSDGMSGRDIRNWIEQAEHSAVGRALESGNPDSATLTLEDFPLAQKA